VNLSYDSHDVGAAVTIRSRCWQLNLSIMVWILSFKALASVVEGGSGESACSGWCLGLGKGLLGVSIIIGLLLVCLYAEGMFQGAACSGCWPLRQLNHIAVVVEQYCSELWVVGGCRPVSVWA